jgi:hypothetical protein
VELVEVDVIDAEAAEGRVDRRTGRGSARCSTPISPTARGA